MALLLNLEMYVLYVCSWTALRTKREERGMCSLAKRITKWHSQSIPRSMIIIPFCLVVCPHFTFRRLGIIIRIPPSESYKTEFPYIAECRSTIALFRLLPRIISLNCHNFDVIVSVIEARRLSFYLD